jgi:hypothetical protein
MNEYHLAEYLKLNGHQPNQNLNLTELKKQYQEELKKHKTLLERVSSSDYPDLHQR